jgi:hypothetical protein
MSLNKNLFVATWSLSESPIEIRRSIELVLNKFDFIFITFQEYFDELNNVDYFNYLRNNLNGYTVTIEQCEVLENNFYFMATKTLLD